MIGVVLLSLAQTQTPPITTRPLPTPEPLSRPLYDVKCEFRDLNAQPVGQIALTQSGGVYGKTNSGLPSRSITKVRFVRDDLGIFGTDEIDLVGTRYTEWHSDGPIELVAENGAGSLIIHKTTKNQAWFESPTQVAVTVQGGRRVRGQTPERSWEEILLIGACDVFWKKQAPESAPSQDRKKS